MLVASAAAGWVSTFIVVCAAFSGVALRRWWTFAPTIRRMRPHYVVGYAAFAVALIHVFYAMGLMRSADSAGLRYATAGLAVLALQTFVGASLQDAGSYRRLLRAWHLTAFAALVVLVAIHVIANGAVL